MLTLERLLDGLDVTVEPFAVCEVRGRAALDLGRSESPVLHYVVSGAGRLCMAPGTAIDVDRNTVLIVPRHQRQRLEAADKGRGGEPIPHCAPLAEGWQRLGAGEGAAGVVMACGAIRTTYREAQGLFDYLPEPLVANVSDAVPIRRALETLLSELAAPQPGTRALARTLMQQCLVLLLRRYCASGVCRVPWLSALEDPRLGRALAAMLASPAAPHTLAALAEEAGMSRSTFAARFSAAFGRSAMDLLRELRLRQAARLLATGEVSLETVVRRIGYQSRSHFSRVFKAFFGASPAAYRRRARAAPPLTRE